MAIIPSAPIYDTPVEGDNFTHMWQQWFSNLTQQVNQGEAAISQEITATGGITVSSDFMRVISATAGNVNITKNPQIGAGRFDRMSLTIEGKDNTRTVTLDNGDGLKLTGGASFTLANGDIITFSYNKSQDLWIEISRSKK